MDYIYVVTRDSFVAYEGSDIENIGVFDNLAQAIEETEKYLNSKKNYKYKTYRHDNLIQFIEDTKKGYGDNYYIERLELNKIKETE